MTLWYEENIINEVQHVVDIKGLDDLTLEELTGTLYSLKYRKTDTVVELWKYGGI